LAAGINDKVILLQLLGIVGKVVQKNDSYFC
jgi:hypothetical protein